jgi:thiol-disulfide isomerase/thioredoxin
MCMSDCNGNESMAKPILISRRRFLGSAAMTIAAAQFGTLASAKTSSQFSALEHATTWLNSPPLIQADLQGKVALVEFWTYTCINWRRQLPYVRAWADKYKDHGLIVIGVHAPEFSFEKNVDNVRWAIKNMRIDYPVVLDNDHVIWRAFENEYWPALYFADAKGHIRHHAFGEGQYAKSEAVIQQLLSEAGATGFRNEIVSVNALGPELSADWPELRSGENYVGYERTQNFGGSVRADKSHVYAAPRHLSLNSWSLVGDWTMGREAIALNQPYGHIMYRFHGRDLHLVMGPSTNAQVKFRVSIDGQPPGSTHGFDVDEHGYGIVTEPRMYQLIRQHKPISDRNFDIEFLDAGVEAFSFTFG